MAALIAPLARSAPNRLSLIALQGELMIYSPRNQLAQHGPAVVSIRCPKCGQNGTFSPYGGVQDIIWVEEASATKPVHNLVAGLRRCPSNGCWALVFVVYNAHLSVIDSYPPRLIDFDSEGLPEVIKNSLEEAITCHGANAYRACALMVRRTLEELCSDRGAKGGDLKTRLSNLGSNIVVPKELLDAADELRLLGNDAAHIEAKSYDQIGGQEAGLAVELTKELLKAVYQYATLVDRLRGLKRTAI